MGRIATIRDVADVEALIDVEIGPTDWLLVDQARVQGFADATGDDQWIHVDVDRSREGPYGGTLAHGYLTLSLIPFFSRELVDFQWPKPRLNYGLNRVRFPAAVPTGSQVRCRAAFLSIEDAPAGALLTTKYTIELEGADRPACVAETVVLLLR